VDTVLAGFGLGLAVAAGFGPISVLALTSGLRHGFAPAFGVAVGVALVDGFYALLAGLGLAALIDPTHPEFQVVGGIALVVIGVGMIKLSGGEAVALATFRRGFVVSVAATLANPLTIVSWAAAFTAVVPELDISRTETLSVLPLSVCLGTLTWFTLLAAGATLLGRRLSPRVLHGVSVAAGVVIALFGGLFVARGLGA
jgi:threonine/homoserine/homoserine lactone efflux protein